MCSSKKCLLRYPLNVNLKKVHRNDGGCPDRFIERMFKEIIIKTLTTFFITEQIFKI